MKTVDCIIVGSGIAGTSLAWELYKRNISFVIISNSSMSCCSVIAPGVWNPIVFKRINPTWNATKLLEHLIPFYKYVEKNIHHNIVSEMKILHVINNPNEEKLWNQKKELYPRFLKDVKTLESSMYKSIKSTIKCGEVANCGKLNSSEYLSFSLKFFSSINAWQNSCFNYSILNINPQKVKYDNISAEKIIFCEGYLIKHNPWFQFVKLKPAKGEIIEIETSDELLPEKTILHKQISIIPNGKKKFLIGSNYDWENLNETPTPEVKTNFLLQFENIFKARYRVIGHYAGIRPASIDRKPILGHHPEYKNLFLFNGLGTKGVMLAPYCAKILADALFHEREIEKELSPERFLH